MHATDPKQITLVYLARMAEGLAPVKAFAASYRDFPAGIDHVLTVIVKGADNAYAEAVKNAFGKEDTIYIRRDDSGRDINAYLDAAHQIQTTWSCFLNTFSVVRKPRWLEKMFAAATLPSVGLIGATGSYESLVSSIRLHRWFVNKLLVGDPIDPEILHFFGWLQEHADQGFRPGRVSLLGSISHLISRARREKWRTAQLRSHRMIVLRNWDNLLAELNDTPEFPNPHIRTNGFMIKTEFLRTNFPELGVGKWDVSRFENGRDGLTNKMLRSGLKVRIVGDHGSYEIPDWPDSQTFRQGNQEQLLIGDNQTSQFDSLSDQSRDLFRYMTWGDSAITPKKVPDVISGGLKSSHLKKAN